MDQIVRGLARAVHLICAADPAVREIIWLSLLVTGLALAISTVIGVPAGAALGLWSRIRIRGLVTVLLYTGMGLPPVVVGLAVYLLLSRAGPLGGLNWLFTPRAMVLAQIIIALPVVAGLTILPCRAWTRDCGFRCVPWAPPAGRNWRPSCAKRESA